MKKIGLICAMKTEVPGIIPFAEREKIVIHHYGNCKIGVIVSNQGKENASAATKQLCNYFDTGPHWLLHLGICGSNKKYKAGTLLIADSVVCNGSEVKLSYQQAEEAKRLMVNYRLDYDIGRFQTLDKTAFSKKGLDICEKVIAFDKESIGIAQIASDRCIPLIIVKAVSDVVPDKISWWQFPLGSLRFLRNFAKAREELSKFAQIYFSS